jgi:hypothetical protein
MKTFTLVSKVITVLVLAYLCFKVAIYEMPSFWGPVLYEYDLRLPSPDGRYDLVVLRGDAAAFADFSYRIYVFPHALAPEQTPKGKRVLITGIWRDKKYLIYSGYAIPMFRWTSAHEIEIDIDDLYDQIDEFQPVPSLDTPVRDNSTAVLVSLVMNKEDARNTMP